jgi:hypothetical protein
VGLQLATNLLEYRVRPQQYIVVPETKYFVTIDFELARSRGVVICLREMLATVELDYQPSFDASKVGDVPGDWILSAKFVTE